MAVCKHLKGAEPDARGRVYMRNKAYECGYPIPEKPALPPCFSFNWPPYKSWVWKDDCAQCPFFEKAEK